MNGLNVNFKKVWPTVLIMGVVVLTSGCRSLPSRGGDSGQRLSVEPSWIRDGQPIVFEGESWFPIDDVENLLDSEVYVMGDYEKEMFFVDKMDVRPFNRLYTRFAKNKYRAFEKKEKID